MPRRDDLKKILVLGSGPIVIGQACEFDYSGTQAVKALVQDGFEVVLLNSNPATIMTDPEIAARTYVAPLVPEVLDQVLAQEKPQLVSIGPRWTEEHFAMASAALEAGAHLFCEKPFTTTLQEADRLLEMARQKGLRIAVAHQSALATSV